MQTEEDFTQTNRDVKRAEQMRYDTTLKELFHSPPQRLLQMLVGGEAKELLSVEYPAVSMRRPDLVVG